MLTELMHGISEFIAEDFKNWDMETRIRHLFRERSKNTTIHEAKILQICHDERVGWGDITNHYGPSVGSFCIVFIVLYYIVLYLFSQNITHMIVDS